jgi:hypothetical protein
MIISIFGGFSSDNLSRPPKAAFTRGFSDRPYYEVVMKAERKQCAELVKTIKGRTTVPFSVP